MKKIRAKQFLMAFYVSFGVSAAFLLWLFVFGKSLAQNYFQGVTGSVFAVFALAGISFLTFCFVPYFRGDKRWFAIPSLFTLVFFVGASILWQVPMVGGV